jgi:uncharacterized protein YndB with AHSA1/START domain
MSTTQVTAEPGSHEITVTRELQAPPELVYRTFSEPDLLAQWLGPRALTMKVDSFDLRHGGTWRFVHVAPDGDEHWFHGCFHGESSVEAGITQTWEYEGVPGDVSLQRATFAATPTGTVVRLTSVHLSVESRDAHIAAGMVGGVTEGFERMDELIERLARG